MVARLAQVDEAAAQAALEAAGWKIKPAVLVAQGFDIAAADAALRQAQGVLRNVAGARAWTLRPELLSGKADFDPALCAVGIALARTGPAWRFRGRRGPALGAPVVRAVGRITRDGAQGAGTADARRCAVAQTGVRHLCRAADRAAFGAVGGFFCRSGAPRHGARLCLVGKDHRPGITRGCACLWPARSRRRSRAFLRIRTANDEPLALEQATVPARFLPDLGQVTTSLYDALDRLGNKPVTGLQRITASLATEAEAGHLCVPPGCCNSADRTARLPARWHDGGIHPFGLSRRPL